jgi:hypothetical protein
MMYIFAHILLQSLQTDGFVPQAFHPNNGHYLLCCENDEFWIFSCCFPVKISWLTKKFSTNRKSLVTEPGLLSLQSTFKNFFHYKII